MNEKLRKTDTLSILKGILLTVFGTLALSFGTAVFIIPYDLVSGGISGISIIIEKLIPLEFITSELIVTVITWALFFIGLIVLGKNFALKTLISTVLYPVGVSLFMRLATPELLGGFFYMKGYTDYPDLALLLAALLGGACVGGGCAITFLGGGSTGGVDIIALTACKIFRRAKSSVVLFIIDATIVICGMFVIQNFIVSLLGILSALVSALMVDKVFIGSSRSFIAQIITDKHEELNREIIEKLERGSTVVDVIGGYTGDRKRMLIVSFKVNQYAEILNTVNKIDKKAFITIHQAHEINGEGWTR